MIGTETILRIVAVMAGVHACGSALELLSIRERYADDGLMSWKVVKTVVGRSSLSSVLTPILTRYQYVLAFRVVAGLALVASALLGSVPWPLVLLILATDVVDSMRHTAGLSGAFQMSLVVNTGLLIAAAAPDGHVLQDAGLLFVAVQGILGYFVAGVSKLRAQEWRSGIAILMVLSTETWGHERGYDLVTRYPRLNRIAGRGVIAFECLFPLVLLFNPTWTFAAFALAFVFHVTNAYFMGINSFLVIFPATYPAIYYANRYLNELIGLSL